MKKINFLLLVVLIFSISSCRVKKSTVVDQEIKTEVDSSSSDKGKEVSNINTEIKKEVVTTNDGTIKTTTTTITPEDKSKPAEFVNNKGEKIVLNNAKYIQEEKEELVKNNIKENINTKITNNNTKLNNKQSKVKAKSDIENKTQIREVKSFFSWWWLLFIPLTLMIACYAYFKIYT